MSGKWRAAAYAGAFTMCSCAWSCVATAQPHIPLDVPAPGVVPPVVVAQPPAPAPAPPPTPVELTPTGPAHLPPPPAPSADYLAAMKKLDSDRIAVAAWFDDNPESVGTAPAVNGIRFNPGVEPFEVDPDASGAAGPDEQVLALARTVGMLRAQLKAAQYPDWLYELQIRKYESEAVRAITDGTPQPKGLDWLVADIEQQRQLLRPDLPPLEYALFMGMNAPMRAIIRSQPSGGRVWIISQLRFEVCRAQFADPFDRSSCTKWRETDPENAIPLSGTYVYQVGWVSGETAHGMRTISFDSGKPQPVVFLVP